jgi:hypothetical protein
MNTKRFSSLGVLASSAFLMVVVAGCSASDNGNGNKGGSAGASGSTGQGGSFTGQGGSSGAGLGGSGGGGATGPALTFDTGGFVPIDATMLGVTGAFYKYSDGLGANGMEPGKCQGAGHTTCSTITIMVDPAAQKICAMGTAAAVEGMDFANMFGSGIGFDLNNAGGDAGTGKQPYNATGKNVTGVGFKVDPGGTYGSGVFRIEFPAVGQDSSGNGAEDARFFTIGTTVMQATDGSVEARFATATVEYAATTQVAPTNGAALLGFQWHVATGTAAIPFNFCLSNIHLLTN